MIDEDDFQSFLNKLDKDLETLANDLSRQETMKMLRLLAIHFTEATRIWPVPKGTRRWRIETFDPVNMRPETFDPVNMRPSYSIIELIPFFGCLVGYNEELDALVICPL